jgi:hypothetical protein
VSWLIAGVLANVKQPNIITTLILDAALEFTNPPQDRNKENKVRHRRVLSPGIPSMGY